MQARRQGKNGRASGQCGFTLLEILIAIALFSLLSALVFQTFNWQTRYHQQLSSKQQRWVEMVKAWQIIERDLSQLVARPVRDSLGDQQAALFYPQSNRLSFTTLNWYAAEIASVSQMQRVAYDFDANNQVLYREALVHADSVPSTPKRRFAILEGVLGVNYKMINRDNRQYELWPLPNMALKQLPSMVVVSITTEDFGTLERNFYVPY